MIRNQPRDPQQGICGPKEGLATRPVPGVANPHCLALVIDIHRVKPAVRQGDWKLSWKTVLPSRVERFNLAADPNEQVWRMKSQCQACGIAHSRIHSHLMRRTVAKSG
jgi:hypothetical protein